MFVAPAAHAAMLIDAGTELAAAETLDLSHVPGWVQVTEKSATLYAADDGRIALGAPLACNTFVHVLGAGRQRLLGEVTTDSGQVVQKGWLDPDAVLPSASAVNWLVTASATTLWRAPDGGASAARQVEQFSALQQIDGPVQGRIEVRVYRSDFSGVVDQGWVDQASTGPALAPSMYVPDPTWGSRARAATGKNQQQDFLDAAAGAARTASARTGVPASVTVAQAILESDWGRSLLAQSASNYFGIKATGGLGNDGVVWMTTGEYDSVGQGYQTMSPFRAYKSLADSLTDHDLLLRSMARYAPAMQVTGDARQFAQRLAEGGYATDPEYAAKLIALMDRYDLYRLDA
jgi:hypothetical protein